MTERQDKAIKAVNKALKELYKAGVVICGMDGDLLYATKKALSNHPDDDHSRSIGSYCPVARANQYGDEDTGHLYSEGYQDSGGW